MKPAFTVVLLCLGLAGRVAAQVTVEGRVKLDGEGLANAVVYLMPIAAGSPALGPAPAVIDQRDLRFWPRVVAVTPGSPVDFLNSDSLLHNVFSPAGPSGAFDLGTYATGERRTFVFANPGTNVILCHVHPEMVAYVVVVQTSARAATDAAGEFTISSVPPGEYQLFVTHRRRHLSRGKIIVGPSGSRLHMDIILDRPFTGGLR